MAHFAGFSIESFSLTPLFWWGILLFLAYAEIHFRYRFLPSLLYQEEPEIVFDLPLRSEQGREIPLFLFIKDAHRFPVTLLQGHVLVSRGDDPAPRRWPFSLNHRVQEHFFSRVLNLPPELFPQPGRYQLRVHLEYRVGNTRKSLEQDNYPHLRKEPFLIEIAADPLPTFPGWYWGDLHVHSNFTEDQVEFGAPVRETVLAAQSMGLHFLAITDHSYDLDDLPEDYTRNDSQLQKWQRFQEEIQRVQEEFPDFTIIPGEEVSVGNRRGKNVHCLVLNDPTFHPGAGDSAEQLFRNRPTLTIGELLQRLHPDALAIAAHPVEKPPLSQRLILNRGIWELPDVEINSISNLQILNGIFRDDTFYCGLALWKILLASRYKVGIVAGNDAHGNFNIYRQVKTPFLSLHSHRHHLLGKVRTAVFSPSRKPSDLLRALREHRALISNGPIAIFSVEGFLTAHIGELFPQPHRGTIRIQAKSTPEYGFWRKIVLYLSYRGKSLEEQIVVEIENQSLEIETEVPLPKQSLRYIRLEGSTIREKEKYYCYTNPIWFM